MDRSLIYPTVSLMIDSCGGVTKIFFSYPFQMLILLFIHLDR